MVVIEISLFLLPKHIILPFISALIVIIALVCNDNSLYVELWGSL